MNIVANIILSISLFIVVTNGVIAQGRLKVICKTENLSPRISYATEQLKLACDEFGVDGTIEVKIQDDNCVDRLKPEGYRIKTTKKNIIEVVGADGSGVLYGCLELAEQIRKNKSIPKNQDITDAPEFKLRGTCIGMQKLQKDPYGGNYQWPYTPEYFPFFYDKGYWKKYLDFLVGERMNSLFLWNGHPFASLVQLDGYPEALEVSPEILAKNHEMMLWLTSECDKRGIWLIQMFYNIHLPKGLGLGTSLKKTEPIAADYTRKSIAKFIEEYPNVGLLVCLGEALSGSENQVEWFTQTIIPGVKDGLKARNQTELPPIVVRGHHIVEYGSHKEVLSEGLKLYPNLYSMSKYNGESLTSEIPRGTYQQFHKDMAKYSSTHMANVHLLSNLEPFRYADFSFIWNCCRAIRDRLDGNGLHLYPLAYWDWPNTPDMADITQLERDRLWYEIWARYSWKLDRDPAVEYEHWIGRLTEIYGTRKAAEKIYVAYDTSGECAPRLLRRFGITGGNRQCLSLGMSLDQMTDPSKFRVWQELYDSDSPPGETINQYVENEYANKPHEGETPPQVIKEVLNYSSDAVREIEAAASYVTKNKEEFERLRNDMHCIEAMTRSYCAKAEAAMDIIRFRKSHDKEYMTKAIPHLEESLHQYKKLEELTRDTYRYSNTLHGRQRIPWPDVYHWSQLVERYEQELADFKKKVADIDNLQLAQDWRAHRDKVKPWAAAPFKLLTEGVETYEVKRGAKVFTDQDYVINDIMPQLEGLTGIRFSHEYAKEGGDVRIDFEATMPVKVIVGYFDSPNKEWLQVPMLEHVAHANDRGGLDPVFEDAADISNENVSLPKLNVHAFEYDKGKQTIEMIGTGSYVILGIVPANMTLTKSDKDKLTVINEHMGPVIGANHPDVKASDNKGGFETGQVVKFDGIYHMFVNEMFGVPYKDLRISYWTSSDAINWERQSTVVESIPGRFHTNLRSEVWLTAVEYNQEEEAWNIFYVAYRGGDPNKGEIFGADYKGRVWRARSRIKGENGIGGPYEDMEIILQPDKKTQSWEGDQGVDSFNPYKAGDKWYAFYGGHYHIPRGPWLVGLAIADKLAGPWTRMPESTNPVPIVKEFIENPVVTKLGDGRYLAIFDSLGDQEIAYSISQDGINWVPETRLQIQSGDNRWAENGDHSMRTPLCAIPEDDGTFTVIYTAKMMAEGRSFNAIGKCTLAWEN